VSQASLNGGWIDYVQPRPRAKLRLFCFPFVGSDASIFRSWPTRLPDEIEVLPVQLPGRGKRFHEPAITNFATLKACLVEKLLPLIDRPCALYGHSMGAVVAFELARVIEQRQPGALSCLLVSGCKPPHLKQRLASTLSKSISSLPEREFIAELVRLNGTPPELIRDIAALRTFVPALRADFQLLESVTYEDGPNVASPIVAFCGTNDDQAPPRAMLLWRELTTGPFDFNLVPGDHFFLLRHQHRFLDRLAEKIDRVLQRTEHQP
jgi:medium-chain acyl-[acyl-carrier-protein] hydrolase